MVPGVPQSPKYWLFVDLQKDFDLLPETKTWTDSSNSRVLAACLSFDLYFLWPYCPQHVSFIDPKIRNDLSTLGETCTTEFGLNV